MNIVNVMACLSSSDGIGFFEFEDFNNFLFNRYQKRRIILKWEVVSDKLGFPKAYLILAGILNTRFKCF